MGAAGGGAQAVLTAASLCPVPCSLLQANPELTMDCIVQMAQHITGPQKAQVAHLLSRVDTDDPS